MKKALIGVVAIAAVCAGFILWDRTQGPSVSPSPSVSGSPEAGESVVYTSTVLGVSFRYVPVTEYETFSVRETGDRIYLFPSSLDVSAGQFVQVFPKRADETFETSIRRQVLADYPSPDCTIATRPSETYPGAVTAQITYPVSEDDEAPYWENAKLCNQRYAATNGIRYFLYDPQHPERFVYLDIGQYGIPGSGETLWQDTLRLLAR